MDSKIISLIIESAPLLMQGAALTLKLWLGTMLISLSIGIMSGILQSKKLWVPIISPLLAGWAFIMRAVPFYVQLLITYFVIPSLLGINLSAFTAGVIALGLCSSGYMSQIVRAGINSIGDGQWAACFVLGYTTKSALRYVILPQMMRNIVPALINELDAVLKSTSIISSIGVLELTRMGMNIVSRTMSPIPIYLAIACMYLLFSSVLMLVARWLERRFAYDTY